MPLTDPAPSGVAGGAALFERLEPGATGVEFVNPIEPGHPMAFLYASSMACGGVAVGDVDGDGRPDLYLTGGPGSNALYRQSGVGALEFEDITAAAGVDGRGAWSTGAAIVDIDNDGDRDIYVCNYESPNLLYLNDGAGVFTEAGRRFGLDLTGAWLSPAFADFDCDGHLDLYLVSNYFTDPGGHPDESEVFELVDGRPRVRARHRKYYTVAETGVDPETGAVTASREAAGQPDLFLRNDGAGRFGQIEVVGQFPGKGNGAVWWDPDGDRFPDLYVANDFKDADAFFVNRRGGGFDNVLRDYVPHTTWFSMGLDSADLDGDGRPDLMVADMSGTNHFKQKVGMGAMGANAEFLGSAVPRQYMRNAVFLNPGGGRFLEAAHLTGLANSDWTWTVRLSDFDNDGKVDVYLTNGMAVNLNVSDNPAATEKRLGETQWARHVRAGTERLAEANLAFRNLGDLEFENVGAAWGLDHVGMSFAAAAADLDRDGDLELVVANLDEPVSIYENRSAGTNRLLVQLRGTASNRDGIGATVEVETDAGLQTRYLTLARGYLASGEPVLHFGLGEQARVRLLTVRWPSGHTSEFADVPANQLVTVTEADGAAEVEAEPTPVVAPLYTPMQGELASVVHEESEFDDYARQPLLPHKHSQLGPGLAVGDLDGDGDAGDLFVGGAKGQAGRVFAHRGGGRFAELPCPALGADAACEDMGALFFDADADGDQDLYVVSGGVECEPGADVLRDRLYLNDGSGGLTRSGSLPDLRDSGSAVAACDFDTDGDLDLFVGGRVVPGRYPLAPESRILRNTGGVFSDCTGEVAPGLQAAGLVTGALWSDADGDGLTDLLTTSEWGPVRIFRNIGGKLSEATRAAGVADLLGWWNGIAGGDFDGDGDIDYAVTNLGLNTKYHASPDRPLRLYAGDFDGTGNLRLVEAEYEDETLYPVRGLSCSSQAIPALLDKFSTYKAFAAASLGEIYQPQALASAHEFTATELRSGVLLNDGRGAFEFRPLPRVAQIAPGFGVACTDADGDGHLDLYVVQNFFSPQVETGRMAGGVSQLLLGRGDGAFGPAGPAASGLVVPGDGKSLAVADWTGDGREDFVVGVNDGALLAFANAGTGPAGLAVRLVGPAGNPTGVGARVTLTSGDGRRSWTREVAAGGGYLSQSSPVLVLPRVAGRLEVTWPGGHVTESEAAEGAASVSVAHPG